MPVTSTTAWVSRTMRQAREAKGWSQADLATELGKTQTAISYWESGKRTPGLDDLIELAENLDVPMEAFFPPARARPATAVLRATAERLAASDLTDAISRLLSKAESKSMPARQIGVFGEQPANAANELLEKATVNEPPVDVYGLASMCGALVIHEEFPDSLSGLVFEYENGAVIGINRNHHANRQRFSTAHELGHYLLGHHRTEADGIHLDISEGAAPGFDWRAERAANDFAAELLMPRRFVSAAHAHNADPAWLAERFEVSQLAMGYRLVSLGLR